MKNDYKPKTKEILTEIVEHTAAKFSKVNLNTAFTNLKDMTTIFGSYLFFSSIPPYVVPSVVRQLDEEKKDSSNASLNFSCSLSENTAQTFAGVAASIGVISYFFQGALYVNLCEQGHSEALLIPVATNLISGAYEVVRGAKKRLQEKNSIDETIGEKK